MSDLVHVLIIDDSAIVREILKERLSRHPGIKVVGTAPDPYVARYKIERERVDVITLDIEMPRMDGLTFLKYLMKYKPLPVIMVSSLSDGENKASILAMELGAVDIVPKPDGSFSVEEVTEQLTEKILAAAKADIPKLQSRLRPQTETALAAEPRNRDPSRILSGIRTTNHIVAIGASTGGTQALEHLFRNFQVGFPPVIATIHMPPKFTDAFARRLDEFCPMHVTEAKNGEKILPSTIYISPGGWHTRIKAEGKDYVIQLSDDPKVWNQRPAVDILFESMANQVGRNCTGVILTGMGKDGAKGLLAMRQQGAHTVAQDEASCIVFGMPKEAIALGGAEVVLGLDAIAGHLTGRFF